MCKKNKKFKKRYWQTTKCVTIREFRQSLNLTLQEFADNIDVSKSYYEKIESGQRKPSREFMTKLKHKFPQFDVNIFFTEQKHKMCEKTKN